MHSLKRMFKRRGGKSKSKRSRGKTGKRRVRRVRRAGSGIINPVTQSVMSNQGSLGTKKSLSNALTNSPIASVMTPLGSIIEENTKGSVLNISPDGNEFVESPIQADINEDIDADINAEEEEEEEDIDLANDVANELAEGEEENNYITPLSYAELAPYNLPGGSRRRRRRRMKKQRKTKKVM